MKQKWKKTQFVELSMYDIFNFQDKLDEIKEENNLEKVWDIVDDFFMECENQLELDPSFLEKLKSLDLEDDFITLDINEIDNLFENECGEDYNPSHIEVLKEYLDYIGK